MNDQKPTFDVNDIDQQLQMMRAGRAIFYPVKIGDWEVELRPLSTNELIQVEATVKKKMSEAHEYAKSQLTESIIRSRETLFTASKDLDGKNPKINPKLLDAMTSDEITFCYDAYIVIMDKASPKFEEFDDERVKEAVEHIKKNPKIASGLRELSFGQLVSIATLLIKQAQ